MPTRWIDVGSDHDAARHTGSFWASLTNDLDGGKFWADEIKQLRSEPAKRLAKAIENLPLPAAFREGAVALRQIIRDKRKGKERWDGELKTLYWLAAVRSFMLDYASRLQQPGYNVMEAVPGATFKSLPFEYASLGYEKLELLNKTDCKWMVEAWGEPTRHTTLNQLHESLWLQYENKLIAEKEDDDKQMRQDFQTFHTEAARKPQRRPWWKFW